MAKQQKCEDCKEIPSWLTTFGDLMALLLTFFVLLLSFSSTSENDFQKALGSLQGALGVLDGEPILSSPIQLEMPIVKGDITEARPTLKDAFADLEEALERYGSEEQKKSIEVVQGPEGITIRIRDKLLFGSGKAEVKEEFKLLLTQIGAVLTHLPNPVEIEGHTDNMPISNESFKNNHWLSNSRALQVLDIFSEDSGIDPARLSAVGHGEYKPLVDNDTPENRAKNRRVEIKVRPFQGEGAIDPETVRQLLEEANLGVEEQE